MNRGDKRKAARNRRKQGRYTKNQSQEDSEGKKNSGCHEQTDFFSAGNKNCKAAK